MRKNFKRQIVLQNYKNPGTLKNVYYAIKTHRKEATLFSLILQILEAACRRFWWSSCRSALKKLVLHFCYHVQVEKLPQFSRVSKKVEAVLITVEGFENGHGPCFLNQRNEKMPEEKLSYEGVEFVYGVIVHSNVVAIRGSVLSARIEHVYLLKPF